MSVTQLGPWRKSSYSNGTGGECIEVAPFAEQGLAVRDSKDPNGPVLAFSRVAWVHFLTAVRRGELGESPSPS
jgi:hypothetical protein